MKIDLAFIDKALEKRFAQMVIGAREELGGLLFFKWGQIGSLHFRTHRRLFGANSVGLITDWIMCPNVSNSRHRQYQVSDLSQLIGIAEQTEEARGCFSLHFHTHPKPAASTDPSKADLDFWWSHFNWHGSAHGVVVAENRCLGSGFMLTCHSQQGRARQRYVGRFLEWRYINRLIRNDEKARSKKA